LGFFIARDLMATGPLPDPATFHPTTDSLNPMMAI
jgi:hypothetical protein